MTGDAGGRRPGSRRADRRAGSLPKTVRERALATRGTFLFHLRPLRIPRRTLRWTHTLGLGGSALVLWLALASSGCAMLLVYQPVPNVAYDSVRSLLGALPFGPLVRGVHYWSANLLVVGVGLHVARVVLTGGAQRPRRVNWVVGVFLLCGVLASAFSGYLLPWDQRAFWAVTISTGMLAYVPWLGETLQRVVRGGDEIGSATLLTFYTYHTTVLPVMLMGGMAYHFWRVRKAGGVVEPPPDERHAEAGPERVLFLPSLLVREIAQALVVLALVVVLGAFVGAPIGERANAGMSPNPAKAPWYFLGFQELLIHLHPAFAVWLVPSVALAAFVALPWLGDEEGPAGRWLLSTAGRRSALLAAAAGFVLTLGAVFADDTFGGAGRGPADWVVRGVVPLGVLGAVLSAGWIALRRRPGVGRSEALQALVLFLGVAFVTLTAIGAFLRGEGMALRAPWGR